MGFYSRQLALRLAVGLYVALFRLLSARGGRSGAV